MERQTLPLTEPCLVKLEAFEGPLDLLLYLIKKNEVNIYDIPVAMITEQYLEYLEIMKELNLEIVGDYLLIASELGLIKSKMLLPKPEIPEEDDGLDPRAELVKRLIEYKRYKDAAMKLFSFDILERDVFIKKYYEEEESKVEAPIERVDLLALVDAFHDIYKRKKPVSENNIQFNLETLTVEEKIEELLSEIQFRKEFFFNDLLYASSSRFHLVITFLACLEVIRSGIVTVFQESPYSPIKLIYSGQ